MDQARGAGMMGKAKSATWDTLAMGVGPLAGLQSGQWAGYLIMGVAVLTWAMFALSIRAIGASPLTTADVALIRFGVPALVLLPCLPARWQAMKHVKWLDALMVLAGAGLPFFFMASAGGHLTSAAHVSALIAGTSPLSMVLLTWLCLRQRASRERIRAVMVIVLGVAVLVLPGYSQHGQSMLQGSALLLAASLLWAGYTLAIRRTGLDAVGCVLLLSLLSTVMLVPLMVTGVVSSHLMQAGWKPCLPFLLIQGLGTGIVSSLAYTAAIGRLGAARCAVMGSLSPALAAVLAVPLLVEPITLLNSMGVVVVTLGVMWANKSEC